MIGDRELIRPAREVAERLEASGRRRIPLAVLREAFAAADPSSTGSVDRRRMLAEVVDELVAAGVAERSGTVEPGTPALPTQLRLLRTAPDPPVAPQVVWHPRLRDADGRPDPRGVLRAVNRWLFGQRGEPDPAPLRERAFEITGDEKSGDLDAAGLRIPSAASTLAVESGLPPVRPATGLYTTLLTVGVPQVGRAPVPSERARDLVEWLDPDHRHAAVDLLVRGTRLAQEAVGRSALETGASWRAGLDDP